MAENAIPKGKLADIGTVIPMDQVSVGDVILFGVENTLPHVNEIRDADPVVLIDEKGLHFAGGTYIGWAEGKDVIIVEKAKLAGTACTLNGVKATISGSKNRFATVRALDGSGMQGEWAWETVARIVGNGGAFRT